MNDDNSTHFEQETYKQPAYPQKQSYNDQGYYYNKEKQDYKSNGYQQSTNYSHEPKSTKPMYQNGSAPMKQPAYQDDNFYTTKTQDTKQIQGGGVSDEANFNSYPEILPQTVQLLAKKGITSLFPIQSQCFYPIYDGFDVIGRDLTGSGKTLAFGLPLVESLRQRQLLGSGKIRAIVLAPTRELAIQVQSVLHGLKHRDNEFQTLTVYGGVSIEDQTRSLRRGVDIFVGTTGRVLDHIRRGNIDFSSIETIILDETDVMLKQGFKEDIEEIMKIIKGQCQNHVQVCLFSATIPQWVQDVAAYFMTTNFKLIDLAQNLKNKTASQVDHFAIYCNYHDQEQVLSKILQKYGSGKKTIVFTQTKEDAKNLAKSSEIHMNAEAMHGDVPQQQRESTMHKFKTGRLNTLIATDVASRGLDIPNVDLVVQLQPPVDVETYIHRSGRTARAGKSGICITFYSKKNQQMMDTIQRVAGVKFENINVPTHNEIQRASSEGVIASILKVGSAQLRSQHENVQILTQEFNGNVAEALAATLAYFLSKGGDSSSPPMRNQNYEQPPNRDWNPRNQRPGTDGGWRQNARFVNNTEDRIQGRGRGASSNFQSHHGNDNQGFQPPSQRFNDYAIPNRQQQNDDPQISDVNVHLSGINYDMQNDDLVDWFEERQLAVKKVHILRDLDGKSKGCGFAEFTCPEDAKTAVEQLSGSDILGRKVNMSFAKKQPAKPSY